MLLRFKNRPIRSQIKFPVTPLIILFIVIASGTMGYNYFWSETNSTLIDELYMTFVTISTIGYEEIYPLDNPGRIFTMVIGTLGIGSLFYILSVAMENLVILQLSNYRGRKKMEKKISNMEDHIILVGFGRVGRLATQELKQYGEKFVVVDQNFENSYDYVEQDDLLYIEGDATLDDVLIKAGINKARGMIITTARSSTTVFVVLSAKVLNPELFIVARSDNDNNIEKINRAGADRVVNPYSIGGQRLANLMINPNVVEFIETSFGSASNSSLTIENIKLPDSSSWYGKTLKEINVRQKVGATVLAVIRNGSPITNPGGNFKFLIGDQLVVFGTRDELKKLYDIAVS